MYTVQASYKKKPIVSNCKEDCKLKTEIQKRNYDDVDYSLSIALWKQFTEYEKLSFVECICL